MANPASSSVDAFTALDEGQQRAALASMSPETKTALLSALQAKQSSPPVGPQPDVAAAIAQDVPRPALPGALAPSTFSERIGERIKENVYAIPEALDALSRTVRGKETPEDKAKKEYFENLVGKKDYQSGTASGVATGVVKSAAVVPRMIYDTVKGWIQDPASAAGDIISGYATHQIGSTGKPTKAEAVPPKLRSVARPTEGPLTPEQQARYTSDIDSANAKFQKEAGAYNEKVSSLFDEAKQQQLAEAKRSDLASKQQSLIGRVRQGAQDLYQQVRTTLDSQWNDIRTKLGNGDPEAGNQAPVDVTKTVAARNKAVNEELMGNPQDMQVLKNLLNEIGIKDELDIGGGKIEMVAPAGVQSTWGTLRTYSNAIGRILAKGNLPPNIFRALKTMRTGIEADLEAAATKNGLGKDYQAVKAGEHEFRTDFEGKGSVARGEKQPISDLAVSANDAYAAKHILGPAGDILVKNLRKWDPTGALADSAQRIIDMQKEMDSLPTSSRAIAAGTKKVPTAPELEPVKRPTPKPSETKAGPIARTVGRLAGKVAGGTVGHAAGHPLLGYGLGGELGQQMADRLAGGTTDAVPPKLKGPGVVSKAARLVSKAARRATAGAPAAAAVVGLRTLRGEDPDSQAINDANEDIQKFIDSLPK